MRCEKFKTLPVLQIKTGRVFNAVFRCENETTPDFV